MAEAGAGATHECPAPGCAEQVPHDIFACRPHWYSIPKQLRDRLWRTWKGPHFDEYCDARDECVAFLEQKAAV